MPEEDASLLDAVKKLGAKNWKRIAEFVPNRNHTQCLQRYGKVLAPDLVKGHWTPEEDSRLVALVRKLAVKGMIKNWAGVANDVRGRTSKQCRERWFNHLDPSLKRGNYTAEEDRLIVEQQALLGNRWSVISGMLPGRTEDMVKIRFKALARRQDKEGMNTRSQYKHGSNQNSKCSINRNRHTQKKRVIGNNSSSTSPSERAKKRVKLGGSSGSISFETKDANTASTADGAGKRPVLSIPPKLPFSFTADPDVLPDLPGMNLAPRISGLFSPSSVFSPIVSSLNSPYCATMYPIKSRPSLVGGVKLERPQLQRCRAESNEWLEDALLSPLLPRVVESL